MKTKVAILQHEIGKGGRLSVIARIIKNLNEADIIPDIITGNIDLKLETIPKWYGYSIQANIINLKFTNKHLAEYYTLLFNKKSNTYLSNYDWVINSSNTSHFLDHPNLVEYLHYPRYARILDRESIINTKGIVKFVRHAEHYLVKNMYQTSQYPTCDIYANSHFTAERFKEVYPHFKSVNVLYPPVSVPKQLPEFTKNRTIINVGRFHSSKKQFEIIQIAQKLTDFNFVLVGFASKNDRYLKKCIDFVDHQKMSNVRIYPNTSIEKRDELMHGASYFIHLLQNEPFGISTVQGIANGCIPIVPNSGGQIEIVNNEKLRFDNLNQLPDKLKDLDRLSEKASSELYKSLFNHIQDYSTTEFDKNFRTIMNYYVK